MNATRVVRDWYFTMRQFFEMHPWHRKTLCFLTALVILTILGPFGTYTDMTFFARLVFWTVVLIGIGAFVHFAVQLMLNMPAIQHLSRVTAIILGAMIGAVPGVGVVAFAERVMRPPGMTLDSQQLAQLWIQVATISVIIALVEYWRPAAPAEPPQGSDAPQDPQELTTAFHDRLPASVTGPEDIISLSMQDHYVEVITDRGKHLILIRLGDAIRELDGLEGLQIHRSHWVARAHLRGLRRKGHRAWVDLSDGRSLSVSKTYLADVEDAIPNAA